MDSRTPRTEAEGEGHNSNEEITCSLCGTRIYQPTPYGNPVLNNAIRRAYGSAAKVEVSLSAGEQNSDWGAGETTAYTLCPDCFEHKLMPWLEAQGAIPEVTSWVT